MMTVINLYFYYAIISVILLRLSHFWPPIFTLKLNKYSGAISYATNLKNNIV